MKLFLLGVLVGSIGIFFLLRYLSERADRYYEKKLDDINKGNI